uniref:Aminopeptidase N n=1 Tax=Hirondellea gigas TaxID=1518452 RepID=A0A6A7FVN9_9CRUS
MPPVSQSREVLTTMDSGQSMPTLSFGRKSGCFVTRNLAVVMSLLFAGALLATGLLVYYYAAPQQPDSVAIRDDTLHTPVEASSTSLATAGIGGGSVTTTAEPMMPETTTATTTEKVMDVRLPRSIKPIKYMMRLQPFINGNFSIMGYIEVTMEVLEPTSNVSIHMADIITFNETIRLKPMDDLTGSGVRITQHKYDKDREFYVAMLEEPLMQGKQYVLSMMFEGLLNDQLKGFYRSQYTDEMGTNKMLATTQFQPTDARRAFPCFDEPALKAEFEVYIARQTNMSAISNMPMINTTPVDGQPGWVWDHFNTTLPMSTYLVAFVVSDFTYINSTSNDHVLFRVWAREQAISQAQYAKSIGPDVLTWFEQYFDIPFPLPKQDMIAIPDFSAGAMENWGLITYRETALLYDPAVSAARNKQRVAVVVSHELAHQWFGDLVTPSWWTDLWLNEGFASYLEYLGVDSIEPSWQMLEQFVLDSVQSVFALDCLESSHPISIPVGHPDEINEIFDRISYDKGASIIRMMNHFLTEPTLRKGLTNYLKHFEYDSAEQDDLWRFLTKQAHADGNLPQDLTVKIIMDTWTLQMGYPVINVALNGDGTATFKQERFLLVKNPNSTDTHDYKWWVPITFTTQDNPDFTSTKPSFWMADTDITKTVAGMPSSGKWVIVNMQETGYYRVNYQMENWKLIAKQLVQDHTKINVINRAQLIDDALDLARADMLTYSIALDINSYLVKETEYVPWKAGLNNLGYIKNMLGRTAAFGSFKRYLLSLVVPLYDSVGFEDIANSSHLDQYKRVAVLQWACALGHDDCTQKSVNLFSRWMANPTDNSIVSPNLKSTVFCTAIAEGGEKEWNFGWQQYLDSNVATEKISLLRALGCTKQIWILSKYLEMAFTADSGVRKQDSTTVFRSISGNEVGRDIAWNYVRNNWDTIVKFYGSGLFTLGRIIEAASARFTTSLMLKELKLFRMQYADSLSSASRTVDQSIERTSNNIAWAKNHYKTIVNWLTENGYDIV